MTIMDDILEFRTPKQLHALYICLDKFLGDPNKDSYNYETIPLLIDLQNVWYKKIEVKNTPKTLSQYFIQALLLSLLRREKAALKEEREVVNEIKQQIERLTI